MVDTTAAQTFVEEVTPSGIAVHYEWEPKRHYRIRQHTDDHDLGWIEVPSVTTVLEALDKPGLPWWGMKIGVEGVLTLFSMGLLHRGSVNGFQRLCVNTFEGLQAAGLDTIVGTEGNPGLLTKNKLTVNHVRKKAADRGQSVHDALEVWAKDGLPPDPAMFPQHDRGYVIGLLAFLNDVPSAEPLESEVMVGSLEHEFAGRYDLRIKTTKEHMVVVHRTPVRGPQWAKLAPGRYLTDLKTSSDVYQKTHGRQLAAYEGASVECGYPPTDGQGVIQVSANGTYKFVRSVATYEHFLHALQTYRDDEEIRELSKR